MKNPIIMSYTPHLCLSLLIFSCFSFYTPHAALTTISSNQSLSGNHTLVSKEGHFELGFFNTGNNSKNYIGMWYKKISIKTYVWVANRDNPVSDNNSAEFTILDGNLVLLDQSQNIVWSTNLSSPSSGSVVAVLLDSGNLVLSNRPNASESDALWQSFDHPSDTWLPGGKIRLDHKTKQPQYLTSWKNEEDPAPDPAGTNAYLILWNKSEQYWTSGPWNGQNASSVPEMSSNYIYNFTFQSNENESYFTYSVYNSSIISRFVMHVSGKIKQLTWRENVQQWNLFWCQPRQQCEVYAFCGGFGVCTENPMPYCNCLTGYEPKSQTDWNLSDYSGGCQRKTTFQCETTNSSKKDKDRAYSSNHTSAYSSPSRGQARKQVNVIKNHINNWDSVDHSSRSEDMNGKFSFESDRLVHQPGPLKKSQSLQSGLDQAIRESDEDLGLSCDGAKSHNESTTSICRKSGDANTNDQYGNNPNFEFQVSSGLANDSSIFSIGDPIPSDKDIPEISDTPLSGEFAGDNVDQTPVPGPLPLRKSRSLPNIKASILSSEKDAFKRALPLSRSSDDLHALRMRQKEIYNNEFDDEMRGGQEKEIDLGKTEDGHMDSFFDDGYDSYLLSTSAKDWVMPVTYDTSDVKTLQGDYPADCVGEFPNKDFKIKRIEDWVIGLQHCVPPLEETNELPEAIEPLANVNTGNAINLDGNPAQKNVGDDHMKKYLQGLLPHLVFYNRQPIKVSTLKDNTERSVRLGMNSHQFDRSLRADCKTTRKSGQGIAATRRASTTSTQVRRNMDSPKLFKGKLVPLPPTGIKLPPQSRHHFDAPSEMLNLKSSMRKSQGKFEVL
ncbi:hypothetical protein Fmac_021728 [Flemingia macrophylla]|uniref:Bulb-type lectin domain-containing protein n=1 Tax=Flemingia macrophylla TaxID=520843 RepID=A0ABD1LXN7_9FABA